jgi:very-short-patch-repair endonuclease
VVELDGVARAALEHLDHAECESACYRCLKSYQNQRYHQYLSWPHAMPALESLAAEEPKRLAEKPGDVFDARAWLEAFEAGVGSPLELKFLRELEKAGIAVEKQVPISLVEGGKAITRADFAIPAKRVAIYVDGAAFHTGANLRRDKAIRRKLRESALPWTVVELRAQDLGRAAEIVSKAVADSAG